MNPQRSSAHIVVVGGGVAGLVAAWDLARSGCSVEIFEAQDRLGGAIGAQVLSGGAYDAGAEAFATRSSAVPRLLKELGLDDHVVVPRHSAAWLQLPDLAAPLPATGILGIPGDPLAPDVQEILGEDAAQRAAEDLTRPTQDWAQTWEDRAGKITLGEVVRDRMGQAVLDRLVTPIVSGVHSADPDDLDMNNAAPGLFDAMLREGSLARAVRRVKSQAPAGSAVNSLQGGLNQLVDALERELTRLGARIWLNTPVEDLRTLTGGNGAATPAATPPVPTLPTTTPSHIILAVDAPTAVQLASGMLDLTGLDLTGLDTSGPGPGVALVSLLLHAPELDAHPRGTGMLVSPQVGAIGAKAMTHVSSKWEWAAEGLAAAHGPGHHLVRLSYGRVGETRPGALGADSADEQLKAAAVEDIAALFDLPIGGEQIRAQNVVRWRRAIPQTSAGHAERIAALRARLAQKTGGPAAPSLHMIGAWFAGTGLARVVPDARAAATTILAELD